MQFPLQTVDQLKPLIQGFRKQVGLTQAAMAEKLGITQQSYAQIESNLNATSVERLYMILRILNVELSFSTSTATTSGSSTETSNSDLQQERAGLRSPVKASTAEVKKRPAMKNASMRSTSPIAVKQSDKTKW
jgi:HTH-type transcriptional regulator / antitoxin HipB